MKVELSNNFHNTFVRVIAKDGKLNSRQMRRVYKALCGMEDCCCGGIRGPQRDMDGNPIELVDMGYGLAFGEVKIQRV